MHGSTGLSREPCRAQFRKLLAQGWTDAIRKIYPDETVFTFWDYMRNRWPRDAGLSPRGADRGFHILADPPMEEVVPDILAETT